MAFCFFFCGGNYPKTLRWQVCGNFALYIYTPYYLDKKKSETIEDANLACSCCVVKNYRKLFWNSGIPVSWFLSSFAALGTQAWGEVLGIITVSFFFFFFLPFINRLVSVSVEEMNHY